MLRGRKIIFSKKTVKKEPITIEHVVPVIGSSLAGASTNMQPVIKPKIAGEKTGKVVGGVTPAAGSKKPATIFMLIILVLGFYVIYDQFINEKENLDVVDTDTDITITKIDDTKDYVYYENEKEINLSVSMIDTYTYKDIVININNDSIKSLNTRLNTKNAAYAKDYVEEKGIYECIAPTNDLSTYTYTNTYTYRDYVVYETDNYITVVVMDNIIDICGNILNKSTTTYVIDKNEGIVYTENSLLTLYSTTKAELVKNAIANRTDGSYGVINHDEIVASILELNEVSLYIDNKECLGVYYTGILAEDTDDHYNVASVCKQK